MGDLPQVLEGGQADLDEGLDLPGQGRAGLWPSFGTRKALTHSVRSGSGVLMVGASATAGCFDRPFSALPDPLRLPMGVITGLSWLQLGG